MKKIVALIFGLSLALNSFGGDTNDVTSKPILETRVFHIPVRKFSTHLRHFVNPAEGENDQALLKRFFKEQGVTYDALALKERKVMYDLLGALGLKGPKIQVGNEIIIFVRAPKAELDKIEKLAARIQDDIPLSVRIY